jgi:hypothetical protein
MGVDEIYRGKHDSKRLTRLRLRPTRYISVAPEDAA